MSKLRIKEVKCPAPGQELIKSQLLHFQQVPCPLPHSHPSRQETRLCNRQETLDPLEVGFQSVFPSGGPDWGTDQPEVIMFQSLPQLEAGSLVKWPRSVPRPRPWQVTLRYSPQTSGQDSSLSLNDKCRYLRGPPCQVAEPRAHHGDRGLIHRSVLHPSTCGRAGTPQAPSKIGGISGGVCRELGSAYLAEGLLVKKARLQAMFGFQLAAPMIE